MEIRGFNCINHNQHSNTLGHTNPSFSAIPSLSPNITESNIWFPKLVEVNKLKQIREQTFLHWPDRTSVPKENMIQAGFFNCNVSDRVICIYCNLICQQWTSGTDDPVAVHKALSPNCPYATAMPVRQRTITQLSINEIGGNPIGDTHQLEVPQQAIIPPTSWRPHHAYAEELCIEQLYGSVTGMASFVPSSHSLLLECDEFANPEQLSQAVNDRIDLFTARNVIKQGFNLSIVKSCIENQLKQTGDGFVDQSDLWMACNILQKQITCINGNQENIIIPKKRMAQIRIGLSITY